MQFDVQALGVQGFAVDADIAEIAQQQAADVPVCAHHHKGVLLMGLEGHAIAQVHAQQGGHCDGCVVLEECADGLCVVSAFTQAHPLPQQRLPMLVGGKQAAYRNGHLARFEQALRVVAVEHCQVTGVLVIYRLWFEMHAEAFGHDAEQALDVGLTRQNGLQQMADARAHARRAW